ncbi:MAG: SdpI family protein [Oscillospiraceae bacterium]|nr:SdpI family protein [Oscillospiraceae bacterium]
MNVWLKSNWKKILISCLLTLSPVLVGLLLWNKLPDTMNIHWGADGAADGTGSKAFVVFLLPVILTAFDLLCFFVTPLDKRNRKQNPKAMGIIFWIMPMLSWAVSSFIYSVSLGKTWSVELVLPLLFGALFLIIGNMMPKVTQNKTMGIKLFWTIYNEENWNKTHRLAGKLWVAGGFACLLTAFLPGKVMFPLVLVITFAMIIVPTLYSYSIYKAHKKAGIAYEIPAKDKKALWIALIPILAILIFVGVLLCTGDIAVTCENDAICITADYHEDLTVPMDTVTEITYRESLDKGMRVMGFGSPRLSMGTFQNDEFGNYTLYSYTGCDGAIVIKSGDKVLVVNAKTPEETKALYEMLKER